MRRLTAVFAALALLMLVLAGCGGTTGTGSTAAEKAPDATTTTGTSAAPASNVTLAVGASQNWIKDVDRELAKKFTDQTGIKIDFQVNPDDQYDNIIKTKLATNEAPDIIYVGAGVTLQNYQPEKYFKDLTNMAWVPKMQDWAIKGASVNGKLYGLNTWSVDGSGILYNKQIFDKYSLSIPQDFAGLKAVCKTLLDNGIQPIYDNAKDNWHICWWPNQMSTIMEKENPGSAELLNTNKLKFADSPGILQCMKDYKELYDLGYLGKNALANEWVPGYDAMGTGKAAMILTYTTYQNEIMQQYPDSKADTWGMFPMLVGGCNSADFSAGGIVRAVNAATKNPDEVDKYCSFLVEDDNIKTFYSARADLGEPSVKGISVRPLSNGYNTLSEYTKNGSTIVLSQTVKFWNEAVIGKSMQDMLAGSITPEQCIQTIDADRIKSIQSSSGQ